MFCPKCHTKLDDNTKICKKCGEELKTVKKTTIKPIPTKKQPEKNIKKEEEDIEILDLEPEEEEDKKSISKEDNHQQTITDEDYLKAYIGLNVEWIEKQSFSIPTAILGPFYLLARKQWFPALILIVLFIFSYLYIPETIGIILRVICDIIMATRFRKIYLKDAKRKIEQIKSQNKSPYEILKKCKKKGGLFNIGLVIVIFMVYVIIIGFLVSRKNYPVVKSDKKPTSFKDIQGMHYSLSDDAIMKAEYTNYHYYVNHQEDGTCYITISSFVSSKTAEEYMNDQIEYLTYDKKETNNVKVGEQIAKYLLLKNKTNKQEFLYLKNGSYLYEITLDSNNTNDNCKEDRDMLIKSVYWKKEQ